MHRIFIGIIQVWKCLYISPATITVKNFSQQNTIKT